MTTASKLEPPQDQWKEFDDILAEIEALHRILREISGQSPHDGGTGGSPDAELAGVRAAAADLVARRIVPLSSRVLKIPALTMFRTIIAAVLQPSRPSFRQFVNGFGFTLGPSQGTEADDPTLGRTLIGTFAKTTFPRSITWAHGDAVDVQLEPDPT